MKNGTAKCNTLHSCCQKCLFAHITEGCEEEEEEEEEEEDEDEEEEEEEEEEHRPAIIVRDRRSVVTCLSVSYWEANELMAHEGYHIDIIVELRHLRFSQRYC